MAPVAGLTLSLRTKQARPFSNAILSPLSALSIAKLPALRNACRVARRLRVSAIQNVQRPVPLFLWRRGLGRGGRHGDTVRRGLGRGRQVGRALDRKSVV